MEKGIPINCELGKYFDPKEFHPKDVEKEIYYNPTRHIGMKFSLFREHGAQNSKPI